MTPFVTAGAGFLLAVLWFDLMFDAQIFGARSDDAQERATSSIAAYYRRVTTDASPMNQLVKVAMIATLAAIVAQLYSGGEDAWIGWASLALVGFAATMAIVRTVPNAVRLGRRSDPMEEQVRLSRAIARDHVAFCVAIASTLMLQLGFA